MKKNLEDAITLSRRKQKETNYISMSTAQPHG